MKLGVNRQNIKKARKERKKRKKKEGRNNRPPLIILCEIYRRHEINVPRNATWVKSFYRIQNW